MKNKTILPESDKTGFFHKLRNEKIKKHNNQIMAVLEYEDEIKSSFKHVDIFTLNTISKLASSVKEKYDNLQYTTDVPKINTSELVLSFCKDTWRIKSEFDLNFLYDYNYYNQKIKQCCPEILVYIQRNIYKSYVNKNQANLIYIQLMEKFIDELGTYVDIKFTRVVTDKYNTSDIISRAVDKIYAAFMIDYKYKDVFAYLLDLLAMGICVSKIMFVNRQVSKVKENDEFYNIVFNMSKEIKDTKLIEEKVRPIYDEFYSAKYGSIKGNLLFSMFITILINKMNQDGLIESYEKELDLDGEKYIDFIELDGYMRRWLYSLAQTNRDLDIDIYIILKIINSIFSDNFDLLFHALSMTGEYKALYLKNVKYNNKVSDKERYLKGDFSKEKKQLDAKYSLNNITTGPQFELYLTNLFKELGYQAKHSGKAGDQGADLILKKKNYVYAVQAKYYTDNLSNTPVQEVVGSLKYYNANQGVVITNSSFTKGARKLAKANNVILIDGEDLKKLISYTFQDNHEQDVLQEFED